MDKKDESASQKTTGVHAVQLGVWRVITEKKSFNLMRWNQFIATAPIMARLVLEVYRLGPGLFLSVILAKIWSNIEPVVLLHLSSRLLNIIEVGLTQGRPNRKAILKAIAARLGCVVAAAIIDWWSDRVLPILQSRVVTHFDEYLLRAQLRLDLPASQDGTRQSVPSGGVAWHGFEHTLSYTSKVIAVISQLGYVFQIVRLKSHGPLFALLCVAKPLIDVFRSSLWSKAHIVQSNNTHYNRMRSLKVLQNAEYRQDVISGNIAGYILQEYQKARRSLGDTSTDDAQTQYDQSFSPMRGIIADVVGDFPMMYYAINAMVNPSKISLTSIAILHQSSSLLRSTFHNIVHGAKQLHRYASYTKQIYEIASASNTLDEGSLSYPSSREEDYRGMSFDLHNVTFAYPGSKSKAKALNDVSCSIKAGQLVVIVGANGSGKSTIVKLLTRLYGVESGEIQVDGQAIHEYKLSDLRQATAALTQDHHIYPLSIAENIGLGSPDSVANMEMVVQSSQRGGAHGFISKLAQGFQTILDPMTISYVYDVTKGDKTALSSELEKLRNKVDVSGGERQRLVASRTFMRFDSNNIKFVAVDEPSSALDPEGEWELFDNLRAARSGKTMVFVTHRFGHLTKHADLILCMKDGRIAESGTHEELIAQNGEYFKLYNIQARAFASDVPSDVSTGS